MNKWFGEREKSRVLEWFDFFCEVYGYGDHPVMVKPEKENTEGNTSSTSTRIVSVVQHTKQIKVFSNYLVLFFVFTVSAL